MAASNTFTWSTSTSAWNTTANWTGKLSSPAVAFSGLTANQELFVLGAGSGAYTVSLGQALVAAGSVDMTSSHVTLSVAAGQTLHSDPTALTNANGAGGALKISAGKATLSGGTLQFYQTTVSGGDIFGFGTISGMETGSTSFANNFLTTSGSGEIVADGGTLTIAGAGSDTEGILQASGNYLVDAGATLSFGLDAALGTASSDSGATVNFQALAGTVETTAAVAPGATQFTTINPSNATYAFNATLEDLAIGRTPGSATGASVIDLSGQTITSAYVIGNTVVALTASATYEFNTSNTTFVPDDVAFFSGSDVWVDLVICFAAGTRLLTDRGEVAIQNLTQGDMVMTLDGDRHVPQAVKWIGHRRLDLTQHRQPNLAAPVRVLRGALGDNLPTRDLVLSPDHCLFLDGKLIPVKLLINDMTIVQERNARIVHYYHVELNRHAILLAEGAPAESYLDTGNRAFFSNAGLAVMLHPEFEMNAHLKCWQTDACAPLTVSYEAVKPVWQSLADRAASLGCRRPDYTTTNDPKLRLVADGRVIRPLSSDADRYIFALPAGVTSVRLASRASVPSYFESYLDDWRHLGVAVRRIVVRDSTGVTELPPDHPGLTQGWYRVERDHATMWRWMNGDAVLPIQSADGPAMVEVQVGIAMRHIVEDVMEDRLAA
jgi:Hint domain